MGETLSFPNPMVSSLIVHDGKIISEAFHRVYGQEHAEKLAIQAALDKGFSDFANSDIYVSLEPCSHYGKTPPCADLIVKHKFRSLRYFSYDPNPLVSGQGLKRIQDSGICVYGPDDPSILEKFTKLNKVFYKIISGANFWISLKLAKDSQGKPLMEPGLWQTGEKARQEVHRLRSCHQLLVTSIRTVLADNPQYDVRFSAQELGLADLRNPDLLILKSSSDFSSQERASLQIFDPRYQRQIFEKNIPRDFSNLRLCMEYFASLGYQKILVEAGPTLTKAFVDEALPDETIIFTKS